MKNPITAKRLSLALSNVDMKPQELANRSGVSKASISQYLSGSHAPSNISSGKMSKVLDVDPVWLMGFDVPMRKTAVAEKEITQPTVISKSTITCNTDDESNLILSFRKLNTENKKRCSAYATSLLTTQEMEDAVALNAAHDSGATPEQKQHADNIMEDPDEWT